MNESRGTVLKPESWGTAGLNQHNLIRKGEWNQTKSHISNSDVWKNLMNDGSKRFQRRKRDFTEINPGKEEEEPWDEKKNKKGSKPANLHRHQHHCLRVMTRVTLTLHLEFVSAQHWKNNAHYSNNTHNSLCRYPLEIPVKVFTLVSFNSYPSALFQCSSFE